MPYGFIVLLAIVGVFSISLIMPRIEKWWYKKTKQRAYLSLREDICRNANMTNRAEYLVAIATFQNNFTPGCAAETRMLYEFLNQAMEVDFKKELGI